MSTAKSILVVGVTGPSKDAPIEINQQGGNPPKLWQKVGQMIKTAQEAGYTFEVRQVSPEDLGSHLDEIRALLRQQPWDGYIIGFGVRGDPSLTSHFEDLVNAGRELRPETPMGFNTQPLDLFDTVKRIA